MYQVEKGRRVSHARGADDVPVPPAGNQAAVFYQPGLLEVEGEGIRELDEELLQR